MANLPEALRSRWPGAIGFRFGDTPDLCARLLALVRSGHKTATCFALRDLETGAETMPVVGRCDVALDWSGTPALVIRTTEVRIRPFCEIDAGFALSEGENETLAGWQADHRAEFECNGGWTPEMELVCERFELIEDLAAPPKGDDP